VKNVDHPSAVAIVTNTTTAAGYYLSRIVSGVRPTTNPLDEHLELLHQVS